MRVRSSELFPAYRRRVMANATLSPSHPGHPRRSASVPRNDVLTRAVSQRVALSLVRPTRLFTRRFPQGRDPTLSLSLSLSLSRARACLVRASLHVSLRAYYLRQISHACSRGISPSPSAAYLLKINWLSAGLMAVVGL